MDQCEQYPKFQTLTRQFDNDKYHRFHLKVFHFLVPVSLLSLLFFYSLGSNFQFSTLLFPLFAHTLERKYMFLICNAILVFLAKDTCFIGSSPGEDDFNGHNAYRINEDYVKPVSTKVAMVSSIRSPKNVEAEAAEEQLSLNKKMVEGRNGALGMERDYDKGEESEESGSLIAEDIGNEEDLNIDELNRKFDDFIRKTKAEIRIEAQRQLISVA